MTQDIEITEVYRERWRRARRALRLLDSEADDFASGGVARLLSDRSARLLILPGDPDSSGIEFDAEFWSWWLANRLDPVTGQPATWGNESRPTSTAALRGEPDYNTHLWRHYIALLRCGGLDLGLGSAGLFDLNATRVFRLVPTVGLVWAAIDFYREIAERFAVPGPWEITLALSGTSGSLIGHLGAGWEEPGEWSGSSRRCGEPGALLCKELAQLPDAVIAQALAFSFGGWIEDVWGFRERRFIANRGPLAGQFDKDKYGWFS